MNLTRKPAFPVREIKCEDNVEKRDGDMYEDDSDLEEGEICEFSRHLL